jgi:hypothetical protein
MMMTAAANAGHLDSALLGRRHDGTKSPAGGRLSPLTVSSISEAKAGSSQLQE